LFNRFLGSIIIAKADGREPIDDSGAGESISDNEINQENILITFQNKIDKIGIYLIHNIEFICILNLRIQVILAGKSKKSAPNPTKIPPKLTLL
jgi:hypothetical protein